MSNATHTADAGADVTAQAIGKVPHDTMRPQVHEEPAPNVVTFHRRQSPLLVSEIDAAALHGGIDGSVRVDIVTGAVSGGNFGGNRKRKRCCGN